MSAERDGSGGPSSTAQEERPEVEREVSRVDRRLSAQLLSRGLVDEAALTAASALTGAGGSDLADALVSLEIVAPAVLLEVLEEIFGVPSVDLSANLGDPLTRELLPRQSAHEFEVVPLWSVGNTLTLAMSDPFDLEKIDALSFITGQEIQPCVALTRDLRRHLVENYGPAGIGHGGDVEGIQIELEQAEEEDSADDVGEWQLDAHSLDHPVVRLANLLLLNAIEEGASDVHFEPGPKRLVVRYRIDGLLQVKPYEIPSSAATSLVSRLKVLASMDISEHRKPQDGSLRLKCRGRRIDLRISTFPTVHGEKMVLRLLDRRPSDLDLATLGLSEGPGSAWRRLTASQEGLVLVTGPTGSGKSTTLLATIAALQDPTRNIVTLEDPVEIEIEGVNQGQVNDKAGFTFAKGLRSILRQDPDVILVGEIRDEETARIASQASLTGHLVLSTLHTNDAPSAVTRLIDIGLPSYLVAATLLGVLGQRLVRRACEECLAEVEPLEAERELLGRWLERGDVPFLEGAGCDACREQGYAGRIGVVELFELTPAVRAAVVADAGTDALASRAREEGYRPLWWDGLDKVRARETTLRELARVVRQDEQDSPR